MFLAQGANARFFAAIRLSRGEKDVMGDELTNSQIALLCDIGEFDPAKADDASTRDLERLVSGGFIEPAPDRPGSAYQPTAKGVAFLGERGAGLNEA
jgi:hypothetical protein